MHYFIRQIILISLISFTAAASIGSSFDRDHSGEEKKLLHQQPVVAKWEDSLYVDSHGNETTVSPTVAPSANATTISPTPAPTATPTTSPPTTVEPTTAPPTTAPPTSAPPTPTPSPTHRKWWKIAKFLLKTVFWIFIAGLFFFAFGAVMSNRYRIYYFLRGSWYSFLRKLKSSRQNGRDGSAPSSTLNDIIFSDSDLQEGLLMRET